MPGTHHPEAGEHRGVVGSVRRSSFGAQETVGFRQQRLLAADEGGVGGESIAAHDRWRRAVRARRSREWRPCRASAW